MNQCLVQELQKPRKPVIRRLSARTIVITFLVTYREMRYDNPEEQIRYKELRGFLPDVCNSLVYETKPDQVVTSLNSRCLLFRLPSKKVYIVPECRRYITCCGSWQPLVCF